MRQIKFRAWDKKFNQWVELGAFNNGQVGINLNSLISEAQESCILMQFTGLFDENGVEVYEGDIVKWSQFMDVYSTKNKTSVVEFTNGCFSPIGYDGNDCYYGRDEPVCEVIGNIYEHKHLLGANNDSNSNI